MRIDQYQGKVTSPEYASYAHPCKWIGRFICLALLVSRLLDSLDRFQTIDRLLLTRRLILLS